MQLYFSSAARSHRTFVISYDLILFSDKNLWARGGRFNEVCSVDPIQWLPMTRAEHNWCI
jgi:hypothetical protein